MGSTFSIFVFIIALILVKVVISNSAKITVPLRQLFAPVILTVILVAWTAVVYPFSAYGDNWAIWPAFVIFPFIVIWHCVLVFKLRGNRKLASVVALIHLCLSFQVWLVCLMLISKDSL
jgi:hypothetical protein